MCRADSSSCGRTDSFYDSEPDLWKSDLGVEVIALLSPDRHLSQWYHSGHGSFSESVCSLTPDPIVAAPFAEVPSPNPIGSPSGDRAHRVCHIIRGRSILAQSSAAANRAQGWREKGGRVVRIHWPRLQATTGQKIFLSMQLLKVELDQGEDPARSCLGFFCIILSSIMAWSMVFGRPTARETREQTESTLTQTTREKNRQTVCCCMLLFAIICYVRL